MRACCAILILLPLALGASVKSPESWTPAPFSRYDAFELLADRACGRQVRTTADLGSLIDLEDIDLPRNRALTTSIVDLSERLRRGVSTKRTRTTSPAALVGSFMFGLGAGERAKLTHELEALGFFRDTATRTEARTSLRGDKDD